jgi:PAS domain S-box-containing protein
MGEPGQRDDGNCETRKKTKKMLENPRYLIKYEESAMSRKPNISNDSAELRRRAEARLPVQRKGQRSKVGHQKSVADTQRTLHELEVHQIELEMQNDELQKIRGELEVALQKYTDLYDFAPMGYFSIDESGVILEMNLTGAVLLGMERSRLVNRRLLLFISSTSQPTFLAFLKKVFTGVTDQVCEVLLLKKGGASFWTIFRATSAVCPKGARKSCRVTFGDITERKEAEGALRESEKRYRTLFDLVPVAVYTCDASGVIQKFNRRAAELWGREPAPGDTDERFCGSFKMFRADGGFMPHERCPMAEVVSGKIHVVHDMEVLIERPDGSRITVVVNIRPLKNEQGEVTGAINCFYDITERKRAEEKLRRNEALFSALLAQAPIGVYVVDARLRLQQVNPRALPVFSKVHPLIGRDFSEIIHIIWPQGIADQIMKRFRHTLKTGAPYQSPDFAERRRDIGVKEVYEWQIQRVTMPAGEYGIVCFFNNITKRKQAEAALRRLEVLAVSNRKLQQEIARRQTVEQSLQESEHHQGRLLEQSRHMQEQLRRLSHQILNAQEEERKRISRELHDEIAQAMVGINVHLEALTHEATDNPKGLKQRIMRTQRLVEKSVDRVHRFARELRPTTLDDLGLIPALHAFLKEFTKRTGVRARLTAFAAIEQLNIAKRTVLYRVAHEALNNVAIHAQASRVDVSIEKLSDSICMKVKDDGKSFEVERLANARGNKRLGLLGMRERVEMVGGTFCVESAPGQGTTVQVEIPVVGVRKDALKKSGNATLKCP